MVNPSLNLADEIYNSDVSSFAACTFLWMDCLYSSVYKRKESGCDVDQFEAKVGMYSWVGRTDFIMIEEFVVLDRDYLISEHNAHESGNVMVNIISNQINFMLITHN